jgi:hypothetical protein
LVAINKSSKRRFFLVPWSVGREITKSLVFRGFKQACLVFNKPIKKQQLSNLILDCSPCFESCQIK